MKTSLKPLLLASILACTSLHVLAQPAAGAMPADGGPQSGRPASHDDRRARFEEHMTRRITALKDELKLSAQQQDAWAAYVTALKPTPPAAHFDRKQLASMTTPQRLDKMREFRADRNAQFERRDQATRVFYAQLSPEQQQTFDQRTMRALEGPHHRRPR